VSVGQIGYQFGVFSQICMVSLTDSISVYFLLQSKTSEFDGTNILEEIWYEILVRVPSKMIIRCRSVCKQWLNITTTPKFIEHHHGEQKLQLIVPVHYSGNMYSCLHRVLAINLSCMEDGFQTIIRSTTFGKYKPRDGEDEAKHIVSVVHASVDGLLLLSFDKTCYVVNPATRKSSHLAPVDNAQKVLGLYRHTLTGEYRVLYLRAVDEDLEEEGPEDDEPFCILSIALQNTRSILLTPYVYARLVFAMDGQPPAVIGDHLYWAPSTFEKQITVFDSKSEVFRWMESPAKNSKNSTIKLIELKGKPAVSSSTKGASKVELFMLEMEGCQSESWVRSHTVELPAEELNHSWAGRFESFFVSLDGDILIECVWRDGDREKKSPGQLLYRDQNGELDVLLEAYLGTSPVHVLKESLASHSFLNDHHPGSPLFEGL
jgi:F-box interacting protein